MNKTEIIAEYLEKYPDKPTLTIAKIICAEIPALFKDAEQARSHVRYLRGGKLTPPKEKKFMRPPQEPRDPYNFKLPKPSSHWGHWGYVPLKVQKALILADVHVPYHDLKACYGALEYGVKHDADTVIINGDFCDFWSISRWQKDPRRRNFPKELEACKTVLREIRNGYPDAQIIFKLGNHEERYMRYMELKAPELLGVADFELESILGLNDLNIRMIGEMRPLKVGKLFILHGHEYRFNISNPVNPARGVFLRAKDFCLAAHFHQSSQHSEPTISGKHIGTWSMGCLCDLNPDYMPLNKWGHGFAFIKMINTSDFHLDLLSIENGRVI